MSNQTNALAIAVEPSALSGAATGTLADFTPSGEPLVDVRGEDGPRRVPARTCVPLSAGDVGATVVVVFEMGDLARPIVLGRLQPASPISAEVEVDGTTVVVSGQEKVVLRCGAASITLNRNGKVVIRGEHVVTHAAGVNRIRGGSIQLN